MQGDNKDRESTDMKNQSTGKRFKFNPFNRQTKFSTSQLLVFFLVFAAIGGYFLYRSFAAAPVVATLEAEQMVLPAGGSVITDSSASGGKAIALTANGRATGSVSFPSAVSSLTVTAKGDQCQGSPTMSVAIDGTSLLTVSVSSTSWTAYSVNTNQNSGTHNLSLTFSNNYTKTKGKKTCDRNLYVDVTTFYGPTPPPTPAPTVSLSASPTSVTAGQSSTLTWASTNATSCNASGAWSGTEPTSGSTSTGALNQTSTYSLSCTGTGGSATASATVTVSSSTSAGDGIGYLRLGGSTLSLEGATHLDVPSMFCVSAFKYPAVNTYIVPVNPNSLRLAYKAASELQVTSNFPDGTSPNANTGITYAEAQAHDAANPTDKWILTSNGAPITPWYGFSSYYGGDVGKDSFRQRWVNNVIASLRASGPNTAYNGVCIDNVLAQKSQSSIDQYPTQSAWETAMAGFIAYIGPKLKAAGYYVDANAAKYISGNSGSDDGSLTAGWWQELGTNVNCLNNEYFMQSPSSAAPGGLWAPRLMGTEWYNHWDGWQKLVSVAQNLGDDFCGETYGSSATTNISRYGRGSFLLDWNGKGGAYFFQVGGQDPYSLNWAFIAGTPLGAKQGSNTTGWYRDFSNGRIRVNPTSATLTIAGVSVASGDANWAAN